MKTLIKRITITTVLILTLSGLSFASDFPTTTTTTPSGRTATTGIIDYPVRARRGRTTVVQSIPERPVKLPDETDEAFNNRMRLWEVEIRRLTTSDSNRTTDAALPERPGRRANESDAAYQNRLREWDTEVRKIASTQSEAERLKQVLETLKGSYGAGAYGVPFIGAATVSDTSLIIPTEEMKTEDILAINEDINVMSQIVNNELIKNGLIVPLSFGSGYGSIYGGYGGGYGGYGAVINTGLTGNNTKSMYLQGYGALFLIKVDIPLSAPPYEKQEEQQDEDNQASKGNIDSVWEQTRQQLYKSQDSSANPIIYTNVMPQKYNAQKVQNLKTALIQALKHASNIRSLQQDESVILRITGGLPGRIISTQMREDQSFITYESEGVQQTITASTKDYPAFLRSLSVPTVLVIRVKKSDIDSFTNGELDFDKFREKVHIFSYPVLSGNSETIR